MADMTTISASDLLPVRSRVSWGAIFAGAVIALATYFLLTLLGAAIGLTVTDDVRADTLGTGAAVWAVLATAAALFLGGWVTSQCVVGENKTEAAIHGVIMWGAVFAMILWLVASGVRSGFGAMVGVANASSTAASATDWQAMASRAGVSQADINALQQKAANAPAQAKQAAMNPANQQAVQNTATRVTWWTLAATIASILAAVAGAVVGAGPQFRVLGREVAVPGGRVV